MVSIEDGEIWIVVVGFLVAFLLSLGIGANDVANTFGTSVGAKVLTLRQACILATIFESAGAMLLGAKVSDSVRTGIVNVDLYVNNTNLFMLGNIAALAGACIWLVVATYFKMPVSGTHSVVGAILGFSLVARGVNGIDWWGLGKIILSWFVSPLLAGAVTISLFIIIEKVVIKSHTPLASGLKLLPIFYGATLVINTFSVFFEGPEILYLHLLELWAAVVISVGVGIVVAIVVKIWIVPRQRITITAEVAAARNANANSISSVKFYNNKGRMKADQICQTEEEPYLQKHSYDNDAIEYGEADLGVSSISLGVTSPKKASQIIKDESDRSNGMINSASTAELVLNDQNDPDCKCDQVNAIAVARHNDSNWSHDTTQQVEYCSKHDSLETAKIFTFLQILTAIFGAFAHGGNDVSNSVGPVVSIWLCATETDPLTGGYQTPIWILFIGGVGISVGLWIWGKRVIETMGEGLTPITPTSGFCIELGAAFTVLVASNIGIPVSSTHCKVGSIMCVGRYRLKEAVDWSMFRSILLAWGLTLPATAGVSALIMLGLQELAGPDIVHANMTTAIWDNVTSSITQTVLL